MCLVLKLKRKTVHIIESHITLLALASVSTFKLLFGTTYILLFRLLGILKRSKVDFEQKKIKTTVSIGIAHFDLDDDSTPELMINMLMKL